MGGELQNCGAEEEKALRQPCEETEVGRGGSKETKMVVVAVVI